MAVQMGFLQSRILLQWTETEVMFESEELSCSLLDKSKLC
jgi:hypothetical protein